MVDRVEAQQAVKLLGVVLLGGNSFLDIAAKLVPEFSVAFWLILGQLFKRIYNFGCNQLLQLSHYPGGLDGLARNVQR